MTEEGQGLDRRQFIRRAAVTTAAAAWAAPMIQTVAASPAFAGTNGTPAPEGCFHSDAQSNCMDACTSQPGCTGDLCDGLGNDPNPGPCGAFCNIRPGNACCNPELCDASKFNCSTGVAVYSGSLVGCA